MKRRYSTTKISFLTATLGWAIIVSGNSLASESSLSLPGKTRLCGVISQAEGTAEVLDPSRTRIIEATPLSGVPCGAWGSVGSTGKLLVKLKEGFTLKIGPGTFVQFNDGDDQLTLFKGHALIQSEDASGEFRVITPNSRVRIVQGKAIVIYSDDREETQLVSLEKKSSIENRFESDPRRVIAKAGEASSMTFRQMRPVPSAPKAVSVAGLKKKLDSLSLPDAVSERAVFMAQERESRKFPYPLDNDQAVHDRAPASINQNSLYGKNERSPGSVDGIDQNLLTRFKKRVTGLDSASPSFVAAKEKRRILEEISKLRPEE